MDRGGAFEATARQRALDLLEAARSESQIDAGLVCIGSRSVGRGLHELAELQSARPSTPTEIGVADNGSPESEHALAVARELAVQHGARVSAFEAVSLPAYLFGGPAAPVEKSITEFVENARERIAALNGVEPHAAYATQPRS